MPNEQRHMKCSMEGRDMEYKYNHDCDGSCSVKRRFVGLFCMQDMTELIVKRK